MEARYVHKPAIAPEKASEPAPEPRLGEPPVFEEAAEEEHGITVAGLSRTVEDQIRAHPTRFMAGGFALGLVLGIFLRR